MLKQELQFQLKNTQNNEYLPQLFFLWVVSLQIFWYPTSPSRHSLPFIRLVCPRVETMAKDLPNNAHRTSAVKKLTLSPPAIPRALQNECRYIPENIDDHYRLWRNACGQYSTEPVLARTCSLVCCSQSSPDMVEAKTPGTVMMTLNKQVA